MLILTQSEVTQVFGMAEAFSSVAEAARIWSGGKASVPPRSALHASKSQIETLVMPGVVDDSYAGVKVWYANGGDASRLAGTSAVVLVLDPDLGEVLVDGEVITDLRTGAMTGLAAQQLADPESSIVALVGAGIQARTQALALTHAFPGISEIRVSSRREVPREAFVRNLAAELAAAGSNASVVSARSAELACRGADILVAATTSTSPVIDDDWVGDTALVCSVGSHDRSSAELESDTVARASVVVVDTRQGGIDGAGDVLRVIEDGRLARDDVFELGEILDGELDGCRGRVGPRVLKTVGFAAADMVSARLVVERARASGLGAEVVLHD